MLEPRRTQHISVMVIYLYPYRCGIDKRDVGVPLTRFVRVAWGLVVGGGGEGALSNTLLLSTRVVYVHDPTPTKRS